MNGVNIPLNFNCGIWWMLEDFSKEIMLFPGFGDFKTISPSSLLLPKTPCCLCEGEEVQFVALFPQKVSFILCGYKPIFFSSVNTQLSAK